MLASIFIIDLLTWNSAKFYTNIMPDPDSDNENVSIDRDHNSIEERHSTPPELYDDIFCDRSTGSNENEKNDCF